jgi:hypothetical protein
MTLTHAIALAAVSLSALVAGTGCTRDTCAPDSTVDGCTSGTGYSCTGTDRPEDSDSSLFCSDGVAGNAGATLYCCVTLSISTCAPDYTVQGCVPGSIGFSCTSTDAPQDGDPSLNCSVGVAGNAGSTLYCCVP